MLNDRLDTMKRRVREYFKARRKTRRRKARICQLRMELLETRILLSGTPIYTEQLGAANPFNSFVAATGWSKPVFGDVDADGDLDMLAGRYKGLYVSGFQFFRNTGTPTAPAFTELTGAANPFNFVGFGYNAAPTLGDLDGDGDMDMLAGEHYGMFRFFKNTGTTTSPVFVPQLGANNPLDGVDIGGYSTPTLGDLDQDGDLDLAAGERFGTFRFFKNIGTSATPVFSEQIGASNPLNAFDTGDLSTPTFGDLDGDSDLDLPVGDLYGPRFLKNNGTAASPTFVQQFGAANPFNSVGGSYTAPTLGDLDGDGDLDMLMGAKNGTFRYFQAALPETDVSIVGGSLVVTDSNGGTSNDTLTLSLNGANVRVTDPNNTLAASAGATQINPNTVDVPMASITGNIQIATLAGNDTLTLNLASGDFIPAGGVNFAGGDPVGAPGDALIINGGAQGTVTYNYTNATDGSIVMSNFGTVTYTGLDPVTNTGTATDIIFNLPAGPSTATLGDDGTSGNGLSRFSSATFETTDFVNPTGSLTINRGNAADTLTVNALPDFNASLTIGSAANPFGAVTFAGAVALATNKNLTADASGTISLSTSTSDLATSGTGTISLKSARDITLASGSSMITVNGSILLEAAGVASNTTGIRLDNAIVSATGSGNVQMTGTGGTLDSTSNNGIQLTNSSLVQTVGGFVTLMGTGKGQNVGGTAFNLNHGFNANNSARIQTTSGAITINAIGGEGNNSHAVDIRDGAFVTTVTGSIDIDGNASAGDAACIGVSFVSSSFASITGAGGALTVDGIGSNGPNNGGHGNHGVSVIFGSHLTSSGTSVTVTGTGGIASTQNNNLGVVLNSGSINASGNTFISIVGTGGTGAGINDSEGVQLQGSSLVQAVNGNLAMTGNSGTGSGGIKLIGTSQVRTTGAGSLLLTTAKSISLAAGTSVTTVNGSLTLSANQQVVPSSGSFVGVDVNGGLIQSTGVGVVTVQGKGGTGSGSQIGVRVLNNGDIIGGTSGTMTVIGTGGAAGSGNHFGVQVDGAGSRLTSNGANVQVNGSGGSGGDNVNGVSVSFSGLISAGSTGTVNVTGTGGSSAGPFNHGVSVNYDGSMITSNNGAVQITGMAGTGVHAIGVSVFSGGTISAGGATSTVTLHGTGGTGSINSGNSGVTVGASITGPLSTSQITSSGGAVQITGIPGTGGWGIDVIDSFGSINTPATGGNITLIADSMRIENTVNATNASSVITLRQNMNGTLINLGGADVAGTTLGLTDAELDRASAGALQIGDGNSSTITVSQPISRAAATNVGLTTGGNIAFGGSGSLNANGGSVALSASNSITTPAGTSGTDVTAATTTINGTVRPGGSPGQFVVNGNLDFSPADTYAVEVDGTTPGTQHDQIVVTSGGVTLGNAALSASGTVTAPASAIVIIDNDGADAVVGTFNGLPEGSTVTINAIPFNISYVGGTGNDVVLTAACVVTNTNDSGAGSLREAINCANANPGLDTISFAIPGGGPHTINIVGPMLPFVIGPTIIDGFTQAGSSPNSNPITANDNAVRKIIVDGTGITSGSPALMLFSAGGSIVRGIQFQDSVNNGIIFFNGSGSTFAGNFVTGVAGFAVQVFTNGHTIGGSNPADRNIISGNGVGVHLFCGTAAEQPFGCAVGKAASNVVVAGNFIGVAADGVTQLANSSNGVRIDGGFNNTIGGPNLADRNVVAGNGGDGVENGNGVNNTFQGNYIGVNRLGNALGNGANGVAFGNNATNNLVLSNVIAHNSNRGIYLQNAGNRISQNAIHSNGNIGIDLNFDGVTPNDLGDGDSGGNNRQNFPVITSVTASTIDGTLNSTPNTLFTLEFFANAAVDASGHGEGQTYLGAMTATTNAGGNATFSFAFTPVVGQPFISATATDPSGNTSEFSGVIVKVELSTATSSDNENSGGNIPKLLLLGTVGSPQIIDVTVTGGSATGADFTNTVSVTIPAGVYDGTLATALPINLAITPDAIVELNETIELTLANASSGLTIGDANGNSTMQSTHTYTIVNDDSAVLNLNSVSGNENAGPLTFTATLTNPVDITVTAKADSSDSTAMTTDSDYATLVSKAISIAAGLTSDTFSVTITPDNKVELDELFNVLLSSLSTGGRAVTLGTNGVGTIVNDDSAVISVNAPSSTEGTALAFSVSISNPVDVPVTANRATLDGSATTADSDYTPLASSNVQLFAAGSTAAFSIPVSTTPDNIVELNETLNLLLSTLAASGRAVTFSGGGATLTGTGTILNDDMATVTIDDVSLAEGNAGTTAYTFTVGLSKASSETITVDFATGDGTAQDDSPTIEDNDYQPVSGALTFLPGQTSRPITVLVNGDLANELNETFFVNLSNARFAGLADATRVAIAVTQGLGTILNDDVGSDPTGTVQLVSGVLKIEGTENKDIVVVNLVEGGSQIKVIANFSIPNGDGDGGAEIFTFNSASVNSMRIVLRGGDDHANVGSTLLIPALIKGGADDDHLSGGGGNDILLGGLGKDKLNGGNGHDVLVGGENDDQLNGGDGQDVLIGGRGKDDLKGNQGDDLLIGGFTSYDDDQASLKLLMAEWSLTRDYNTRVANLRSGTGPVLGVSGVKLKASGVGRTVFDDGAKDTLQGGNDRDWYFADLDGIGGDDDNLKDKKTNELVDLIFDLP